MLDAKTRHSLNLFRKFWQFVQNEISKHNTLISFVSGITKNLC